MPSFFVGVDVSQKNLDVFIEPIKRANRFHNTAPGHQQCIKELLALGVNPTEVRVVLESTGGFELPLALALQEAGFEVAVIKPERARFFAKASGKIAKTDAIDATVLAHFCQVIPLAIIPLPTEEIRHFRDLLDRRQQLMEMRIMESNRKNTTIEKKAQKSIDKHIDWIDREMGGIEAEIDTRIANNPQWNELDRIIQSIPGVGPQTSRTLIGQLPELGRVNRKVIGHLVGLAPIACDSGEMVGQRHIVGGRKQVRNVLYMAALCSSRSNPLIQGLYKRLCEKGKPGKVALVAAAHKLLTIINAMVQKKTTWQYPIVEKKP